MDSRMLLSGSLLFRKMKIDGVNRMKKMMEKIKSIPVYGWIMGLICIGFQYGLYLLADLLSKVFGTQQWAFIPKISCIDDKIPLIPAFIVIYMFSYAFWIIGVAIASLTGKRHFTNYMIGLFSSFFIGFLILLFMPTYMDRVAEGLLDYTADPGLFDQLLAFIYRTDGVDRGFNLFPSFHCLNSLYCYLAIRGRREISAGVRTYTLVMVILICCSTVFTKQHYVADVAGGLLIPTLCYLVVKKLRPEP